MTLRYKIARAIKYRKVVLPYTNQRTGQKEKQVFWVDRVTGEPVGQYPKIFPKNRPV